MSRGKFFRFRDRGSYKASEVLALFVISLIGGMFLFAICAAVDYLIRHIMGQTS